MSTESNVSTSDTPVRNEISVVTEEPQDVTTAAPSDDTDQTRQTSEESAASNDDKSAADQSQKGSRRQRRTERRIKALQTQVTDLTGERDQLAESNRSLKAQLDAAQNSARAVPEPKLADFASPQEYAKAFTAWEKTQSTAGDDAPSDPPKPPKAPQRQSDSDTTTAGPSAEQQAAIEAFREEGIERLGDDFLESFSDRTLPMSLEMFEYVAESDLGPELVVALDDNRRRARQIFNSDDPAAGLKKLEADLAKSSTDSGSVDLKTKTAAQDETPPPGDSVRTSGDSSATSLEDAGMEEYAAIRRKQDRDKY